MKTIFFCISLVLSTLLLAEDSWELQTSGTTENLNSICFLDGAKGFAAGNNATLLKTNDGGGTWSSVSITATSNFNQLFFKTSTIGFLLAQDGTIYRSADAGANWLGQTVHNSGLNGIDFNGENGIVVGDDGHTFTSTDGGLNWTDQGSLGVFTMNDVQFLNDSLAIAVGASGSIYKSVDKGNNWISITSSTTSTLSAIDRYNANSVFICGTNGLIISFNPFTDEVTTLAEGLSTSWLKGIDCQPDGDCYSTGTSKTSLIFSSQSWISRSLDENVNLNDVSFVGNGIVYYCGIGGVIYKTTAGGYPISAQTVIAKETYLTPNPVDDILIVHSPFIVGTIQIMDLTGKRIFSAPLKSQTQQLYTTKLPAGIYLIMIQSDEHSTVKKFLKN